MTRLLVLTGSPAGILLGVDGRTIRRWIRGEREVPYSAWRLLLLEAGMALPGKTSDDNDELLTWGELKAQMIDAGVRDSDVVEYMDFAGNTAIDVRRITLSPDEHAFVQVVKRN